MSGISYLLFFWAITSKDPPNGKEKPAEMRASSILINLSKIQFNGFEKLTLLSSSAADADSSIFLFLSKTLETNIIGNKINKKEEL